MSVIINDIYKLRTCIYDHKKSQKYRYRMKKHSEWLAAPILGSFNGTNGKQADFSNWVFYDDTFSKETFLKVIFDGVTFNGCTFVNVDFDECKLRGAKFLACTFSECRFNDCWMPDVVFDSGSYMFTGFYNSNFENTIWANIFMTHCAFNGNIWLRANFNKNMHFSSVDFKSDYSKFKNMKSKPYIPLACPSHGAFVGWKVCNQNPSGLFTSVDRIKDLVIVKLEIPATAKRSSAEDTGKCRCDKAKVLGIYKINGKKHEKNVAYSLYTNNTIYQVGKMVYPDSFDENRFKICSNGIHFFANKQDAINFAKNY